MASVINSEELKRHYKTIIAIAFLCVLSLCVWRSFAGYSRKNCVDIYLADNASETSIAVQNTWYTIAGTWDEATLNEWTRANGVLTTPAVGGAGHYYITWSASLTATAEDQFEIGIFRGATRLEPPGKTEIAKTGVAHVSGVYCVVIADATDIELKVRNTTNTGNVTVTHAAIALHKI